MPDFTTSDGLRLHYDDDGTGQPILCLSGLTRTGRDFQYIKPQLSDARVITLDYRGRGQSDWADPATYTVPVEGRDVIELLDHLDLAQVSIIGTSRGGLIAMLIAAVAKDRLTGVCLNDIGPEIAPEGLDVIKDYVGRAPPQKTHAEVAKAMATRMAGFEGVHELRWMEEARTHFVEEPDGLAITYDPALGDVVRAGGGEPAPDLWPWFDAMEGLPLACIRGANSDLLSPETFAEMPADRTWSRRKYPAGATSRSWTNRSLWSPSPRGAAGCRRSERLAVRNG